MCDAVPDGCLGCFVARTSYILLRDEQNALRLGWEKQGCGKPSHRGAPLGNGILVMFFMQMFFVCMLIRAPGDVCEIFCFFVCCPDGLFVLSVIEYLVFGVVCA